MPNSEYLRLKALLDSNPKYKIFLNSISKAEGTWGKDAYSTTYGGGKSDWKNGKDQTVRNDSSAHGKYQFMNKTWKGLIDKLDLKGFSPEEQDIAALKLAEEKNALKHIDDGEMEKAFYSVSGVWAAIPKDASGKSALTFRNGKSQPAKSIKTVMGYATSNEAARAGINKGYLDVNEANRKQYAEALKDPSNKENSKIIKSFEEKTDNYVKELRKINLSNLGEPEKNKAKHDIKNKYYRSGELVAIQDNLVEENKKHVLFNDRYKKLQDKITKFNETPTEVKRKSGMPMKWAEEIEAEYEALGLKKNDRTFTTSDFDLEDLRTQMKTSVINPYKYMETEKGLLKYGKTKENYDTEVLANTPADDGVTTMLDGTTNKTAEELAAEAAKTANDARILAEQNKPFTGSPILDRFNDPGEYAGAQFEYTPEKQKLPFDALIGLTTGMMGVAAADSVEIKYRDEQIAEGMLQYAQDIAKIKNMGLDPAIEGSLKQKLADGYQTGLQNIVRASNGNRNLVLGNQSQLDQARMSGIVEIAAMDIDRTDKAMAAFGEVQKYISEFEATKSIANDERKYQEDQKKQMAGMQLASSGMANFIDSVQASKENAPGSINDMKRQWFQFQTTGLLPNAKDGEPGSLSHKTALQERQKLFNEKKRTYSDWINSKNLDERELISKILEKNPQWDPTVNKAEGAEAAKFEDLEKEFNVLSGNEANKLAYLGKKEISVLDVKTQEQKVADGTAVAEEKMIQGTTPETQEEINAKKAAIAQAKANGSTVPITRTTQPIATGTIVTIDNLADKTKQDQLNKGILGYNVGPETINETANANALRIEEYNSLKEQNQ